MKFIITLKDLKALVKGVGLVKPKPGRFTLFACAARVFVEWRGEVAGIEELVLADGTVTM